MNARMRRIASDYEQIKKNFSNHKNIVVEPIGEEPAEKYRVTYYVNGIYLLDDGRIETLGKHIVIITLHAEYPRYKPICTIATPIWHPNFRDGQICIGDIWGAGESLSDIIVNIGDMIQYKSWNSFSPLSADAAEWAIENKHLFPVGNINLWTGEEEDGTVKGDFDIDIFDGEDAAEEAAPAEETAPVEDAAPAEEVAPIEEAAPAEENFKETQANVNAAQGGDVNVSDSGKLKEESPASISAVSSAPAEKGDEEDFEITAEELAGIEFVPSVVRMQGSQYGATAKGGKINLKTVLVKGLLWALIGAFLGFVVSEIANPLIGNAAVARMLGHSELADYYEYTELADEAIAPVNRAFADYCNRTGKNPNSEGVLEDWLEANSSAYSGAIDLYSDYDDKADEALYNAYEDDFASNEDALGDALAGISRTHTALWSGIIALFIGLFLGIGEGVYYGSKENALKYALIGAGISIAVGAVSGYLAQWMYASMLSDYSSSIASAFVRGLGWAIMGAGIGLSIGLIKPEQKRILFCTLGGVIGAFIGGFLFNYVCDIIPNDIVARGIAIIIMGLLIGVGVGMLEQFAKAAWLKVIRGEFEGKEYLVFEGRTSIGNSGKNTIVLFKDKLVAPDHCEIVQEGTKYVLVDKGSPMGTVVNGMRITRHVLRQGDAIAIGNSVLVFNMK